MKFETLQDVRDWRNSDKIECLVCHRKFDRITASHVAKHRVTHDEYRALFGIPWSYSLTSIKSRERTAQTNKETLVAVRRKKGEPLSLRSRRRPSMPAVAEYWRTHIQPKGHLNTLREANGRFIEKKAA